MYKDVTKTNGFVSQPRVVPVYCLGHKLSTMVLYMIQGDYAQKDTRATSTIRFFICTWLLHIIVNTYH